MSAPTNINSSTAPKRQRRAAKLLAPVVLVPSATPLTADQLRVAKLFGSMNDECQAAVLRMTAAMAADFPRRAKPTLRLVGGVK